VFEISCRENRGLKVALVVTAIRNRVSYYCMNQSRARMLHELHPDRAGKIYSDRTVAIILFDTCF
jgi:hypothetical protein